jgi:nudix-type nucleoside diphosphatase (YffH/AdpP family)
MYSRREARRPRAIAARAIRPPDRKLMWPISMRIVDAKPLFQGWTKFWAVTVQQFDGRSMERAVLDHGASACVLSYDPARRRALVVYQTRVPLLYVGCHERLMEAIAGRIENEEPLDAIRREAMEEAGVRLRELEYIATCWSSPGVSTERWYLYLGTYSPADRVGPGGGRLDELEDIVVREISLFGLARITDQADMGDAKTLLLVQALRLRRPDLFG